MTLMKRLFLGFALLAAGATASARVVERIVAVIGNDIILSSELDERARPYLAEAERESDAKAREKKVATIQREVLERLVDEQLILQQAGDLKVQVSQEDVDKAIEGIKEQNKITQEQLVDALKE